MRQIVLDTETTGIRVEDGHRIIEIGCLELINRKLTGKYFHCYLNPQREVEAAAMAIHGIKNEFLLDKPIFAAIAREFMDFINGAELIIHNAPFDISFINYELAQSQQNWGVVTDYCRVTDTLAMARKIHAGQRNSLDALCKRYGVDNSKRDLHGALLDADLLAQVYLAMTGGQGSFFEAIADTESLREVTDTAASFTPVTKRRLTVLHANSEELALHDESLHAIAKAGKCVWIDGDVPVSSSKE